MTFGFWNYKISLPHCYNYRVIYLLSEPNYIFDSLSKRIWCCGMGKYIVAAPSNVIKPAVVDKPNPYKVLNPLKNVVEYYN